MIIEAPFVPVGMRQAWQLSCRFDLAGLAAEAIAAGDRVSAATYEALLELAKRWAAGPATSDPIGSNVAEASEVVAQSESHEAPVVGTSEVVRVAGVTSRAVVLAASEGRLAGWKEGRRWRFDVGAVNDWIARRAG